MHASIIVAAGTPFDKQLLLVNSKGQRKRLPLLGTSAWLTRVSPSHPKDVQPSFAENSVCIRRPDSRVTWVVASPTAEDQRSFLDRLCLAGCTVRDIADQIELLPESDQPPGGFLRLGRPTTTRTTTRAEIVALKVANTDEKMSQLLNEAKVLQNLHHDGIVRAYGIYEVRFQGKKSLGMVLDYSKGMDLSSWIPTGGLPEKMVSGIMAPICDAMVYLHGLSVVHRDIKPSNVFCERAENGSVKVVLADFGLAAPIVDEEKMSSRCGTGGFVAPEIFREDWAQHFKEETVTNVTKIDVFSFGMTVYATVFGENPFIDTTLHSTYLRNSRCLLSLSNMGGRSNDLQSLLHGLCAKNPRQRYSSAEALAEPWFSSASKVPWAAFERASYGRTMDAQATF